MADEEEVEEEQHEIGAVYRLQPDGTKYGLHMPVLDCSCDFWTQQCRNWEEAGIEMDNHLAQVRERLGIKDD
jgi:hypothetical protein